MEKCGQQLRPNPPSRMPYMHFTMAMILALSAPIITLPSIRVPDFATPQYMHSTHLSVKHLCIQPTRVPGVGVGARTVVFRTTSPVANCNLQLYVALEATFVVSVTLAHTALITTFWVATRWKCTVPMFLCASTSQSSRLVSRDALFWGRIRFRRSHQKIARTGFILEVDSLFEIGSGVLFTWCRTLIFLYPA